MKHVGVDHNRPKGVSRAILVVSVHELVTNFQKTGYF